MFDTSQKKLTRLINGGFSDCLIDGLKGIEKESLRVTPDGWISQAPHPKSLGAALTHPYITTDYSEALLEFITPPFIIVGSNFAWLNILEINDVVVVFPCEPATTIFLFKRETTCASMSPLL